jgi:hypothetical protein
MFGIRGVAVERWTKMTDFVDNVTFSFASCSGTVNSRDHPTLSQGRRLSLAQRSFELSSFQSCEPLLQYNHVGLERRHAITGITRSKQTTETNKQSLYVRANRGSLEPAPKRWMILNCRRAARQRKSNSMALWS